MKIHAFILTNKKRPNHFFLTNRKSKIFNEFKINGFQLVNHSIVLSMNELKMFIIDKITYITH